MQSIRLEKGGLYRVQVGQELYWADSLTAAQILLIRVVATKAA